MILQKEESTTDTSKCLVLGSGSLARKELLISVGLFPDKIVIPGIDESVKANESPRSYVKRIAAKKADAIRNMIEGPVSASCPASILQMHPRVTIVLDEEASYLLTFKDHYKWVEKNKLDWQLY